MGDPSLRKNKKKGLKLLVAVTKIICLRVAQNRTICEKVDESHADGEGETANRCLESFEELVDDLGLEATYQQAHDDETTIFEKNQELEEHGATDKCLKEVAEANSLQEQALALARLGDAAGAFQAYQERAQKLSTALLVAKAVNKFRKSIAVKRSSAPDGDDMGDASTSEDPQSKQEKDDPSVVTACAGIGAVVGLALLGPRGVTAGIGAAVAGGVVGGSLATIDETLPHSVSVRALPPQDETIKEAKVKAQAKRKLIRSNAINKIVR